MKHITDDDGQDRYACHFETAVEADCKDAALKEADKRFCQLHQVSHWSADAEAVEIERLSDYQAQHERAEALRDGWAFMG
jgi:hypothetical protein